MKAVEILCYLFDEALTLFSPDPGPKKWSGIHCTLYTVQTPHQNDTEFCSSFRRAAFVPCRISFDG